ncbi:PDGLE domain-containing protein [Glycomyces buryatensis]|nr:PDGLE domain-containing protein [Glycomyces buryatensis]
MKTSRFILGGIVVAVLLAGGLSLFASSSPDGLESVMLTGCVTDAENEITGGRCVAEASGDHEIGGPLADYNVSFIDNEMLGGSLSGIIGVLIALGVGTGLFWLLARGKRARSDEGA